MFVCFIAHQLVIANTLDQVSASKAPQLDEGESPSSVTLPFRRSVEDSRLGNVLEKRQKSGASRITSVRKLKSSRRRAF